MQQCDLEPCLLELEILDSAFASQRAVTALRELCADGIRVCIDGFGTRTSSLRSLTLAPIAKVRVGVALVRAAESDRGAAVFLRAIAGAAQAVGASVCATDVASQDDVRALNAFGHLLAQGVLFGAPVDGDGILTLLTGRGAETAELPALIL